jgi:flagellar basal-body rod protein FlgF
MDKVIYIGMSGAKHAQTAQRIHANNLANLNTSGFRADFSYAVARQMAGDGNDSRYMVDTAGGGSRLSPGTLSHTGRVLDVAVSGAGWIAVQDQFDQEAFTRAGHLRVGIDGNLLTETGLPVLGEGGPLNIPPYQQLDIGVDGSISIIPAGGEDAQPVEIGRIKLVSPESRFVSKSEDGLFRMTNGEDAEVDETVQLKSGYLEASNVNAVSELVQMMHLSRQFEVQVKVMKTASEMASAGDRMMRGK